MTAVESSDTSMYASESGQQPHRVLVADDDALLAKSLCHNLSRLNFEIIGPASNGEQAILMAREHRPDLALMDIRMPVVNGLRAATVMFNQLSIPVVIVSAHADPEYLEAGKRVGVFGYMLKPITTDQLRVGIGVAWASFLQQQSLKSRVDDLKSALEDRKIIERAKNLLMDKIGLDDGEAMHRLRKEARDSCRRLSDLARDLIEGEPSIRYPSTPQDS